jgi:hypothetical protein
MGKVAERLAKNPGNLITTDVSQICFPVEMEPAEKHGFNFISSTQYLIIATIAGSKTILNACSDRYELVKNTDIFLAIENMLKKFNIEFSVIYQMIDYSVFEAVYTLPNVFITLPGGDKVHAMFKVSHSYNGLVKYRLLFGFYRLVCSNGLVIPVQGAEMHNICIVGKHTEKILTSIESLIKTLKRFFSQKKSWTERYLTLYDRKIEKWEDRIVAVMDATSIKMGAKDVNFNNIVEKMQLEMSGTRIDLNKNRPSDWLVYNAINEGYVYNNSVNNIKPHMRAELDMAVVNWIYYNPN